MKKTCLYVIVSISIIIISALQIHNIFEFDVTRGFDDLGHTEYINLMKEQWRVPLANEGWELYQPPFYYFVGSLLPTIYAVKWFGFTLWVILTSATAFFLNKVFKSKVLAGLGTILISSLPVVLYMSPSISNEFASAVFISLTIIFYVSIFNQKPNMRNSIILGILLSISLLTKATAALLTFCIVIDILLNKKITQKRNILTVFLGITTLLASWFYIRNLVIFHNPFIASIDFPQYTIEQPPGYRDVTFFMNLRPFITMDLYKAQYDSFLVGTYFSWYFDGHTVIVPVQEFSKAGVALVLWSLPLALLFLKGYWSSLKNISSENRVMLIFLPMLLIAYALYNIKLPFYSTVKGSFILSAIIPWVYFIIIAIKPFKKLYLLFSIYLFILVLLIFKNFWILEWWYNHSL